MFCCHVNSDELRFVADVFNLKFNYIKFVQQIQNTSTNNQLGLSVNITDECYHECML